ncbi:MULTISPECIES: hypothetical protein [unclassified Methylomonas]|nr:hypothetical protein [Methylomonas sp. LW13]
MNKQDDIEFKLRPALQEWQEKEAFLAKLNKTERMDDLPSK